MAILENGLLKLVAAKSSTLILPLGLIGVAAIWAWRARTRTVSPPRDDTSAPHEAAGGTRPGDRTAYRPASASSFRGGTDREALLSQILEDNIRLREALK